MRRLLTLSRIKIFAAAVALIIVAAACECVPNLDTPKEFDPDEASNIIFIHAMNDINDVDVETDVVTLKNISWDMPVNRYFSIGAGINNIRIRRTDTKTNIFMGMVDLIKDGSYTLIGYGSETGLRIEAKVMFDTIGNFSETKSWIRLIHVASGISKVKVILRSSPQIEEDLSFRRNSDFRPVEPGNYFVDIKNQSDGKNLLNERITFKAGKIYSLVLRGAYINEDNQKLNLKVSETAYNPFPEVTNN